MFEPKDFLKLIIVQLVRQFLKIIGNVISQPYLYELEIKSFETTLVLLLSSCMAVSSLLFGIIIHLTKAPYVTYSIPLVFAALTITLFKEHRRIFNSYTS